MISGAVQIAALALFSAGVACFGLLVKGCYVLRRQARRSSLDASAALLKSAQTPMISVITVAPDGSAESRAFVRRLLDLHSARHEVVLVLGEPSEPELEKWKEDFQLIATSDGTWVSADPLHLRVVKTERGEAASAYNAGVAAAAGSMIALFDGAGDFIAEALLRLLPPMLQDPQGVTAVCGVAPDLASGTLFQRFGALESLRVWMARCAGFAGWNMLIPVPGCCLLIRRDAIQQAGGFPVLPGPQPAFAVPLELILHLHGRARAGGPPFRMTLVADATSSVPAPKSVEELRRSIVHDQHALRAAIDRRKSIASGMGAIGWGLPALLCDRLIRPLLETALYVVTIIGIVTGMVPAQAALLVLLCTVATGILVSMGAVVFRELADFRGSDPKQITALFFAAIPENLGYRQLRNLWLVDGYLRK